MEERECKYSKCKKLFIPRKYNQKFCDDKHKIAAWLENKQEEKDRQIANLTATCNAALVDLEQGRATMAIDRLKAAIGKSDNGKEVITESAVSEVLVV